MNVRSIRMVAGVLLAGGLACGGTGSFAQNDSQIPDAQIESNVLKALASAGDLASQNIQSSTVYGIVTLTGNVQDEALRTKAENLAARAEGVKKVVDELTLGDTSGETSAQSTSDDPADQNQAPVDQQDMSQVPQTDGNAAPSPPDSQYNQPTDAQNDANIPPPPQGDYRQQGPPPSGRQPMRRDDEQGERSIAGGQQAGLEVNIPAGSMLRIRINRGLDSNHIQPGTTFDGTVLTDVVAGGAVAIPRGAVVTGTVLDAKKAGAFKGEGELSLQLTSLTLGGTVYPLTSDVWARSGKDKTTGTVDKTVGLGIVGALIGAVAGGGEGAAVGAGLGAGAGLAGSAASPRGQIIIPPESVLSFRTASPMLVNTVSEQEMQRLSYAAGPRQPQGPQGPPRVRYYSPYYGYYYGPPR